MNIKKRLSSLFVLIAVVALLTGGCMKTPDYNEQEEANINTFLSNNPDLPFTQKESGLYYYEKTAGTGEAPRTHDTVYVFYVGKFLNGSVFDSNVGKVVFSFPVGEDKVIPGFEEGISYMKPGAKSVLLIPSSIGYGSTGWGFIPGYTPLLFEVELTKIGRAVK